MVELGGVVGAGEGMKELEDFVGRRVESIGEQIAGKREGFVAGKSAGMASDGRWGVHRRQSLVLSGMTVMKEAGLVGKPVREVVEGLRKGVEKVLGEKGWIGREELMERLSEMMPVPEHYVFDPGPGIEWGGIVFRAGDKNGDGRVTVEELMGVVSEAVVVADRNEDGKVDEDEAERAMAERAVAGRR